MLVPLRARGRTLGVMALGFATVVGARPPGAVRGPRAPRRARDRQRAPLRGARQRRAHAPALAAAARAARRPRHRPRRALRRGRRGQRGRRRLLRLLPHRRRRVGGGDRRRLRQGRRGGGGDRARPLHGARVGDAALRQPAASCSRTSTTRSAARRPHSRFCTVLYVSLSLHGDRVTGCDRLGRAPAAADPARRRPRRDRRACPARCWGSCPTPRSARRSSCCAPATR